ncbi:hypothetical protein TcasGA2_TC033837 [Tribolium castaneum]|uniref:Uncharacterized protein n=1 Tax=Tribolium castaneum TaxID=7070 RepID=A0A139WEZ5_TRICA|nr:PREDICTED: uncharacterized protein LOC103313861 [Tribolium castaneum]KYB26514.1 hypothetical protein TcasGA2_TC033837 [Tribolium castaneum]|eukprot:XP_008196430.1 PREDICTED: uncharacterized protein LOC103313861 [Tribolium castaneum]
MSLLRFTFSFVYSLVGVSGFGAFIILNNYAAAILAIITGFISIITSHIHFLDFKNKLPDWYTPQQLRQMSSFGIYCFAISTSALVYFSVIEIMQKRPIMPIEDSAVIPMIWCLITLKSGLILAYFGRYYSRQNDHISITEEPATQPNEEAEEITP